MDSSIRQNLSPTGLPDFRNPATVLHIFLAANVLGLLTVLIFEPDPARWMPAFLTLLPMLDGAAIVILLIIPAAAPYLAGIPLFSAWAVIFVTTQLVVAGLHLAFAQGSAITPSLLRELLWAGVATALIGSWLHLRQQARSPALAEARLMALSARIRPHFLFNSLNGILGIIRSDPRRAEKALEELAELFRAWRVCGRGMKWRSMESTSGARRAGWCIGRITTLPVGMRRVG